jgi:cobyrinic acid a,c-diamide synthase
VNIGYFADQAFSFYYPENLESLKQQGARLVRISPAEEESVPDHLHGLYIGGGFPEVHAPKLASNASFAASLRAKVAAGFPVFAECGGLMYLARELVVDNAVYPMANCLDLVIRQERRPQGHGYEVGTVDRGNPFFEVGTRLKGHEFHYSHIVGGTDIERSALRLERGQGTGEGRDGIVKNSIWASYLHLHATATPEWADGLIERALRFSGAPLPERWDAAAWV